MENMQVDLTVLDRVLVKGRCLGDGRKGTKAVQQRIRLGELEQRWLT